MLNGGGDDVLAPLAQALHGTGNGPVVGLCAAGGEEYPVGFSTHGSGDLLTGQTELAGGIDAEIIQKERKK